MLDMFPMDESDPAQNYRTIRKELEAFSPALAEKREVIAANKMDLATDEDAVNRLREELGGKQIIPISGVSRQGLEKLLKCCGASCRIQQTNSLRQDLSEKAFKYFRVIMPESICEFVDVKHIR